MKIYDFLKKIQALKNLLLTLKKIVMINKKKRKQIGEFLQFLVLNTPIIQTQMVVYANKHQVERVLDSIVMEALAR